MTPSAGGSPDPLKEEDSAILRDSDAAVAILVESPRDIPPLKAVQGRARGRVLVVATSPAAAWDLEKHGIPFRDITEYCDREAIVSLGMENFQRVQELCERIDTELLGDIPLLGEFQLRPAGDNFAYFKILLDGLSIRAEMLRTLVAGEKPDILFSMADGPEDPVDRQGPVLPFRGDEHVYTTILSCPGWPCRKGILGVAPASPDSGVTGHRDRIQRVSALFSGHPALYNLAYTGKQYGLRRSLRLITDMAKNWYAGGDRLLFTGFAYNWHYLIPELSARGFRVTHLRTTASGEGFTGREVKIGKTLVESLCNLGGIDLSAVFLERANPVLSRAVQEAGSSLPPIRKQMDEVNPAAVLCGARSRFPDHLPGHVAHHRGIPVLSWQHGAQGINRAPIMLYVDAMGSDYHLCFGEGVRNEFQEEASRRFSCDVRAVGSFELQELALAPSREALEFSVLYATTNYYQNKFYISAPSVFFDLDLWATQRAILDLLGRSGKKTAFKLHTAPPKEENISEFLEAREYRNITPFKTERTFLDLLDHSGTVILDFPSTALLQSLAAGKPVFVLTKHLKLTDTALSLLRRRAWCSDDLPGFLAMLQGYLDGKPPHPAPDLHDTLFLEQYGVHRLDGNVAGRAMEILKEARARRSSPPA